MQPSLKVDVKQILAFMADEGIIPSPLSPFYAAEPAGHKAARFDAGLAPLIRAVCQPSASVGVRIISAQGEVASRIYADKAGQMTVRHWIDTQGLHHFAQVREKEIAGEAVLRLGLDLPAARLDIDADLNGASLSALLGLSDAWRERTLLSLIDRRPAPERPLAAEESYAAFRRSIHSADRRWLTPLVQELYPGNLDVPQALFIKGLHGLAPKFAQAVQEGFQLSPLGEALCAALSAPLAAIRQSVRWIRQGAVVEATMLGLRGMGLYCHLEWPGEDHGTIALRNASGPMIELFLHSSMAEAARAARLN